MNEIFLLTTKRSYFYDFLVKYIFSGNAFDHGMICSTDLSSLISISVNLDKRYSKYSYGFRLLSFAVSTSEYIAALARDNYYFNTYFIFYALCITTFLATLSYY